MTIAICGSIYHMEGMRTCKQSLEQSGHTVHTPKIMADEVAGKSLSLKEKHQVMLDYLLLIKNVDAILVYNKEKHGIAGYIGANTLIEMAVAFAEQVPIYLLKDVGDIDAKEEIKAMYPVVIHGNVHNIV